MDRGTWQAKYMGLWKSQTQLGDSIATAGYTFYHYAVCFPDTMFFFFLYSSLTALSRYFLVYHFNFLVLYSIVVLAALCCCRRAFSSCREWGPPPVAAYGLLTVVASLLEKHGLRGAWASVVGTDGLQTTGPVVVAHSLVAQWLWDLPWPGIALVSLALQGRFLTTGPSGRPFYGTVWVIFLMAALEVTTSIWIHDSLVQINNNLISVVQLTLMGLNCVGPFICRYFSMLVEFWQCGGTMEIEGWIEGMWRLTPVLYVKRLFQYCCIPSLFCADVIQVTLHALYAHQHKLKTTVLFSYLLIRENFKQRYFYGVFSIYLCSCLLWYLCYFVWVKVTVSVVFSF